MGLIGIGGWLGKLATRSCLADEVGHISGVPRQRDGKLRDDRARRADLVNRGGGEGVALARAGKSGCPTGSIANPQWVFVMAHVSCACARRFSHSFCSTCTLSDPNLNTG
jgi:hypothetical protein